MPGLITPSINFRPTERLQLADRTQMFAHVGQQLNQRYLVNRQTALNNIYNPLSQMKVRDIDQQTFSNIQDNITGKLNEFRETDDWSQATGVVMDAQADIMQNKGLKAMQEAYAAEAAYNQRVDESNWDTQTKQYFKLRSKYDSSAIEYDADSNEVLSGGFNGYTFGEAFDESAYMKEVSELLSKLPASSSEQQRVLTDPNSAINRGIAVMTGQDGQAIASMFTQVLNASEGVSYDKVYRAAYNLMMNNDQLISYKRTLAERDLFLQRYQKDTSNPNGFTLRDLTPQDLIGLYQGEELQYAMKGLGLNLNSIFKQDKNGNYIVQDNISPSNQAVLNAIQLASGIDITKVLTDDKYRESLNPTQQQALSEILSKGLNDYIMDEYDINSNGSSFNDWASNKYITTNVQADILFTINNLAGVYSWSKTKSKESLVANNYFNKAWDAEQKRKEEERIALEQQNQALVDSGVMSGGSVHSSATLGNIAQDMKILDDLSASNVTLRNAMKNINITDILGKLNITEDQLLNGFNAQEIYNSPNFTEDEKARVRQYLGYNTQIKLNEAEIAEINNISDSAFELYQKDPDTYNAIGYYGVMSNWGKAILKYGLKTKEDFIKFSEKHLKSFSENYNTKNGGVYDDEGNLLYYYYGEDESFLDSFEQVRNNAIHNVISRYNKQNPTKPVEVVTPGTIYSNSDPTISRLSQTTKYELANSDNNGWVVKYTPNGEGTGVSANELRSLISVDAVNRTSGGWNPRNGAQGVDMSEYGIDGQVYATDILLGDTNVEVNGQGKKLAIIVCRGLDGNVLGRITLEKDATKQELTNMATHALNNSVEIIQNANPTDPIADQAMTHALRAAQTVAQHTISIDADKRTGMAIKDMESYLANLEVKATDAEKAAGRIYVNTAVKVQNPYNTDVPLTDIPVRIGKDIGSDSYTIELLSIDSETGAALQENKEGAIPSYILETELPNGNYLRTPMERLAPAYATSSGQAYRFRNLTQGFGLLSYYISVDAAKANNLNNSRINYINGVPTISTLVPTRYRISTTEGGNTQTQDISIKYPKQ